jgi:hypothetical protein
MPSWLLNTLGAAGSILLSLTVTLLFNKLVGIPKELKKQKDAAALRERQLQEENKKRDDKIASLECAVNALPGYRQQSLQIQAKLQGADQEILAACQDIKNNMLENRAVLNERLDRLERREKNAIRAKLIDEYRLFTDEAKNPMLAWSEMEHHAFFALVRDYEDLNGNDYIHNTVLPAMNELIVVSMSDKTTLAKLMASRKL